MHTKLLAGESLKSKLRISFWFRYIWFLGMELLTLCWKNFISAYLPAKEYRYVSMQPILDGGRLERRETHDRGEKYTEKYTRKYKGKYNLQKLRKQTSGFLINCEFQNRRLLILILK